jgi:hypothetical protein
MSRPNKGHHEVFTSSSFVCNHCHVLVQQRALGTEHRNHCPCCLWSCHVDRTPGDRQCACLGAMEPIAIWVQPSGEWSIVHRCTRCSSLRTNRIAGDDEPSLLVALATKPLATPAFPLEQFLVPGGVR